MTRRSSFDGTRQAQALRSLLTWSRRALRTRSGKTLKDLARELSMSPATLGRYLAGATPLGSDQFGVFAAAFETTEAALVAACFPQVAEMATDDDGSMPADDPSWDFLSELRKARPHDPEHADLVYEQQRGEPQYVQREIVAAIRDTTIRERELGASGRGQHTGDETPAPYSRAG